MTFLGDYQVAIFGASKILFYFILLTGYTLFAFHSIIIQETAEIWPKLPYYI